MLLCYIKVEYLTFSNWLKVTWCTKDPFLSMLSSWIRGNIPSLLIGL